MLMTISAKKIVTMASKNVIADLTVEEKLDETNFDRYNRKVQRLPSKVEVLETLTNIMMQHEEGKVLQHVVILKPLKTI